MSNIRTASAGILKTHVTWEEFEANLTKALNTTATFGPNKSALDIGEGIGFCSRCALVDCDWQGEGADKLPKRVVLKMATLMAIFEMAHADPNDNAMKNGTPELWERFENNIKDMHNIECDTYDYMGHFDGEHSLPKVYYARAFSEKNLLAGQICLEYMENTTMMNFHEKATLDQMKQIARALGKLQAESTKFELTSELIKKKDIFTEFIKSMPKEHYLAMFTPLKAMEASLVESTERCEALLELYYASTLPMTIHKQLGITPILVNGDMRTENVLVDKSTGDLRALIDWQCCHLGMGVEDLLRISFFAQTTEDRRTSSSILIEEMHNAFVTELNANAVPYTLDQVKEVYDLLFPHCALFFATGLSMMLAPRKPKPEDDEEKQSAYEVLLDKARGVLEDIATYNEKNKACKHKLDWRLVHN